MELKRTYSKIYAEYWNLESTAFETAGIYERLARITPEQEVLEVGCGVGWGTCHLAQTRPVLSMDNNAHLIALAQAQLASAGLSAELMHADIFALSGQSSSRIAEFRPKGIVAWFIGSHPGDVDRRTPAFLGPTEKPKRYRENLEDRLVSSDVCCATVEWIHLVNRSFISASATRADAMEATIGDYDENLLSGTGFKVADVQIFEWNSRETGFIYSQAHNPNLMAGSLQPVIVSILARRQIGPMA